MPVVAHGICEVVPRPRPAVVGQRRAGRPRRRDQVRHGANTDRHTCRFWHAQRAVLRPLSGDPALAGIVAVTSFATYDGLGALADDPDRAAELILRMARALLD